MRVKKRGWIWWYTTVIPPIQKVEIRKIMV
jgi:hypothetical protein